MFWNEEFDSTYISNLLIVRLVSCNENGYTTIGAGKVFHGGPSSNGHDCEYSWSNGCPYHNDNDHYDPSPVSWQAVTPEQQAPQIIDIFDCG